jgi:hypothetical protein
VGCRRSGAVRRRCHEIYRLNDTNQSSYPVASVKACFRCGEVKSLGEFTRRSVSPDGLHPTCKSCIKKSKREWYLANRERVLEAKRPYAETHREEQHAYNKAYAAKHAPEFMQRMDALKREQGCIDCGKGEGMLHFDHRPGTKKVFSIALGWGRSARALAAELDKCDVRCHSCHARRHGNERPRNSLGQWEPANGY